MKYSKNNSDFYFKALYNVINGGDDVKLLRKQWLIMLCVTLIMFLLVSLNYSGSIMVKSANAKSSVMEFHFLDVSHGDSIIIKYPYGSVVLIDAGKEEYGNKVVEQLKRMGINKIDYIVASHYDMDHIGGMTEVLDNFKVDNFYGPYCREELLVKNKHYKKLVDKLKEKNIKLKLAKSGMSFNIDGVNNYILGPIKRDYKYPNDHSIVMKTVYNKTSFLFTGDLQREGEKEVVKKHGKNLNVDVLKVGHHGYEGSSGEKFLELVSPEISVISGGNTEKATIYSSEVYNRLKNSGSKIYTTYDNGDVVLISDGNSVESRTEK